MPSWLPDDVFGNKKRRKPLLDSAWAPNQDSGFGSRAGGRLSIPGTARPHMVPTAPGTLPPPQSVGLAAPAPAVTAPAPGAQQGVPAAAVAAGWDKWTPETQLDLTNPAVFNNPAWITAPKAPLHGYDADAAQIAADPFRQQKAEMWNKLINARADWLDTRNPARAAASATRKYKQDWKAKQRENWKPVSLEEQMAQMDATPHPGLPPA